MKKTVFVLAAAMAARAAFGIAASQAWVSNYVERVIASSSAQLQATTTVTSTNGVTVVVAGNGEESIRLIVEDPTDAAMLATNCTSTAIAHGVTNGCTFVWNGAGAYVNPQGTIYCTATNLVWEGVGSVHADGFERFDGWFDARGVLIQPHTSLSITNGMTEVIR